MWTSVKHIKLNPDTGVGVGVGVVSDTGHGKALGRPCFIGSKTFLPINEFFKGSSLVLRFHVLTFKDGICFENLPEIIQEKLHLSHLSPRMNFLSNCRFNCDSHEKKLSRFNCKFL
ncbi:hypothetical protein JHK87_022088 [Glycine soja]|nr:hypothetical protein JHK87_022088 [Glycine soja]